MSPLIGFMLELYPIAYLGFEQNVNEFIDKE